MLTNIFINLLLALTTVSLTSGVALHSSHFDKVFATVAAPSSDTSAHDLNRSVANELHVHTNRSAISNASVGDPSLATQSHKKHTSAHHARFKLATLTA